MSLQQVRVLAIEPERWALSPTLQVRLELDAGPATTVHAVVLQCQVRVEPGRRTYDDAEAGRLLDLFGDRSRWRESVHPFLFAQASLAVATFTGTTEALMPLPVSFDLDVAAGKYFAALDDGAIPLLLLFSGTTFCVRDGRFTAEPVPWNLEARFQLPVSTWREVIDGSYPGEGWLRVSRSTLRSLARFRSARACTSWDETFDEMLAAAEVTS